MLLVFLKSNENGEGGAVKDAQFGTKHDDNGVLNYARRIFVCQVTRKLFLSLFEIIFLLLCL